MGTAHLPVAKKPATSEVTTRQRLGGDRLIRAALPPSRWPLERLAYSEDFARAFAGGETLDGVELHRWTVAALREEIAAVDGAAPHPRTSISAVRQMATPAILEELAALGLEVSEETFDVLAQDDHSAWNLGERWVERAAATGEHAEFICLAACELWRRWLPESPSVEMLDELMQEGYLAQERGPEENAIEPWIRASRWLVELTPADITTIREVDTWFPGRNWVVNWLGDLTFTLHNASTGTVALRERARRVYAGWIERFEPSKEQRRLRYELAQMHFRCGDVEAAEEVCRDLIEEQPSYVSPYVLLANEVAARGRRGEALALLESAGAHLEADADKRMLTEALRRLRATPSR